MRYVLHLVLFLSALIFATTIDTALHSEGTTAKAEANKPELFGKEPAVKKKKPADKPKVKKAAKKKKAKKDDKKVFPYGVKEKNTWSTKKDIHALLRQVYKSARDKKLRDIATDKKKLLKFIEDLDKVENGKNSLEASKVRGMIKKFANQKADKDLKKWAQGILDAIRVQHDKVEVEARRAELNKGNELKKITAKMNYNDAAGEYMKSWQRLPKEMKTMFPTIKRKAKK